MNRRILALTLNSIREMYRDRFFVMLVLAVLLLFGLSFLLGELTFEEQNRLLFDLGITAIHWLNLGLALFLGGSALRKDIERQTYMTILSSPVTRLEFLISKFLGLIIVIIICTTLMGVGLYGLLSVKAGIFNFCLILLGLVLEAGTLLACSFLFGLLFSPFVSVFTVTGIFLIGHWLESLKFFAERSEITEFIRLAEGLTYLLPNLYRLNWRSFYLLENGIPANQVLWSVFHAFAWILVVMVSTHFIFRKKQLL